MRASCGGGLCAVAVCFGLASLGHLQRFNTLPPCSAASFCPTAAGPAPHTPHRGSPPHLSPALVSRVFAMCLCIPLYRLTPTPLLCCGHSCRPCPPHQQPPGGCPTGCDTAACAGGSPAAGPDCAAVSTRPEGGRHLAGGLPHQLVGGLEYGGVYCCHSMRLPVLLSFHATAA